MPNIGIEKADQITIAQKLNLLLSNEYALYTQTLKFHWNVEGEHFGSLHAFFRDQYEELFQIVDDMAERVRTFDIFALGTLKEFSSYMTIQENMDNPPHKQMISILLGNHEIVIRQLRSFIEDISQLGDEGTANFLTDIMEKQEKMSWMLNAHLKDS